MTTVPAATVAQQVLNDGGDTEQAQVAAALVSGVESDGDPTELSGGVGPAAGLFQFEPGTWQGDGGGAFAPVAQDASWQDQVQVFLNATQGDNFHDWGPDLTGQGDPNSSSNPSYSYSGAPMAGSPVANAIAKLGLVINGRTVTGATGAGPSTAGTSSAGASTAALNANPFDLFGIPGTVAGGAASATAGVVLPFLARAVLVAAGLSVAILGVYKLASPGAQKLVSDDSPATMMQNPPAQSSGSSTSSAPAVPPAALEAAAA